MIRLMGGVLLWGGCILWGMQTAASARQRVRVLEDIGQALDLLQRELAINQEPLPELLKRLVQRNTPQGRVLFLSCNQELVKGKCFANAWECALENAQIKGEEYTLLKGISGVLGRYDTENQTQMLEHLRQEVERRCVGQREELRGLVRVRCMLGVAVGGFLTLALV